MLRGISSHLTSVQQQSPGIMTFPVGAVYPDVHAVMSGTLGFD